MTTFRAVLFDFDGTLADSYMAITASVNHTLTHYGRPTLTEPQVRSLVGHGLQQLMETVIPGVDAIEAAAIYRTHHPEVMISHTRVLAGVQEGLAKLTAHGVKMGICSNKPSKFTREILKGIGLAPHFQIVLGPDDVAAPKPDPAMIHAALKALDVPVEHALYLGDMEVDIETGRRAGIKTWVMPTGSHDEPTLRAAKATRILANFDAVIAGLAET